MHANAISQGGTILRFVDETTAMAVISEYTPRPGDICSYYQLLSGRVACCF
jgi:hypothetical protein